MEIFDYDHILLLPRKCHVQSRSECDPSVEFGPRRFALPVVPSNMKTVIDEPISEMLARSGHFYVMHRFDLDGVDFAKRMRDRGLFVSISSGVKPADAEAIAVELHDRPADAWTDDVLDRVRELALKAGHAIRDIERAAESAADRAR